LTTTLQHRPFGIHDGGTDTNRTLTWCLLEKKIDSTTREFQRLEIGIGLIYFELVLVPFFEKISNFVLFASQFFYDINMSNILTQKITSHSHT
jgi:hypothetical protein